MNLALAEKFLIEERASPTFIDLLPHLWKLLPDGVEFESDVWNLLAWHKRPGNKTVFNVYFDGFQNNELKLAVKLYVLHKRLTSKLTAGSVKTKVAGISHLDRTINVKPLSALSNGDFYETERRISKELKGTSPYRAAGYLQTFGKWLNGTLPYRISYRNSLKNASQHGAKASEKAKADKLIDTRVLGDLLAKNADASISEKDRFYLSVLTIMVVTGFRINEMATMPKDCVVEDGDFRIRYYPEKQYRLGTRFIPTGMIPAVKQALSYVLEITSLGRQCAYDLMQNDTSVYTIDWPKVLSDSVALRYFARKFVSQWLSDRRNSLYNPSGAWIEARKCYIDVLGVVAKNNNNKSAAARELDLNRNTLNLLLKRQEAAARGELFNTSAKGKKRSNWDNDSRLVSFMGFEKHIGMSLMADQREVVRDVFEDAQKVQVEGRELRKFRCNSELESQYKFSATPVIVSDDGEPVIWPHQALFVTLKNQLSDFHETKSEQYSLITERGFSRWLTGEIRSRGTGNDEDGCFERLGIVDPNTGLTAKFTSHDIRHWLTTIYAQGGLSNQLLSLIFNRDPNSNYIYDQTPIAKRVEILKGAIEEGRTFGHIEEVYKRLIAEESREKAEEYLRSSTLMTTLMPHGMCTLNWMMNPCPHSLSCLSAHEHEQEGPCNHLHVDLSDEGQVHELERLKNDAEHIVSVLPDTAPQYQHFTTIKINVETILNRKVGKEYHNG